MSSNPFDQQNNYSGNGTKLTGSSITMAILMTLALVTFAGLIGAVVVKLNPPKVGSQYSGSTPLKMASYKKKPTAADCYAACAFDPKCGGYTYDPTTQTCSLASPGGSVSSSTTAESVGWSKK